MNKTLVCGSRDITSFETVRTSLSNSPFNIDCIVHGGADGVDKLASVYCGMNNIDEEVYRPDYDEYGKRAPLVRNELMVEKCDNLIAIWNGVSNGTKNTIDKADENGMEVVQQFKQENAEIIYKK